MDRLVRLFFAWLRNAKVLADLLRQIARHLAMPGHGGPPVEHRIPPPRVAPALAHQFAPVVRQVTDEVAAFQGWIATSSNCSPAAERASSRFISIAS